SNASRSMFNQSTDFAYRIGPEKKVVRLSQKDKIKPVVIVKQSKEITPAMAAATIEKRGPGTAFASFSWIYSEAKPTPPSGDSSLLQLERKYFKRIVSSSGWILEPIQSGDALSVGDTVEVQLKVT